MHMDIFNDDAFSAVSMTVALEDYEFKPNLLGSLNQTAMLQIEMTHYRARAARLAQLESHPLLRFAFAGNRLLRRMTGRYRRERGAFK